MPFTYTFQNSVVMSGWDEALLRTRATSVRLAAYTARWGVGACPPQDTQCPEELLRRLCWPLRVSDGEPRAGAGPKCWYCRQGRLPMPTGNNRPVGADAEDLLPCGCEWKYVAVELHCKFNMEILRDGTLPNQASLPQTLDRSHREVMWEFFSRLHGAMGSALPGGGEMQVIDLVSGHNRVAALTAALAAGRRI